MSRVKPAVIPHCFLGTTTEWVLIVAGLHASEQSGIEVARWIRVLLATRSKLTRFSAVVIPEVYPDRCFAARTAEWKTGNAGIWREVDVDQRTYSWPDRLDVDKAAYIWPNRQFPPPGQPLAFLRDGCIKDSRGNDLTITNPVLRKGENVRLHRYAKTLLQYIEAFKPVRIVSIHGKRDRRREDLRAAAKGPDPLIRMTAQEISAWEEGKPFYPDGRPLYGINFAGIFVDPRYRVDSKLTKAKGFDVEGCKFNQDLDPAFPMRGTTKQFDSAISPEGRKDDEIACRAAQKLAELDTDLAPGNHISSDPQVLPVVHYAKEAGTPKAFSLGDWGPVDVDPRGNQRGSRLGAPVFTIEVKGNEQSWAFIDDVQCVDENLKRLSSVPTPAMRAVGQRGRPMVCGKFSEKRCKQLQNYARATIDTILELP